MDADGCCVAGGAVPEAVAEAGFGGQPAAPVAQASPPASPVPAAAPPQQPMAAAPQGGQGGEASPPPQIMMAPSFNSTGPRTVELQGKVAMVTGASQGVGLAVVTQFVNSGASVIMVDNNEA